MVGNRALEPCNASAHSWRQSYDETCPFRSTDWQSLTFVGERHRMLLRVPGPGADDLVARLVGGLADAEFSIVGQIVADIGLERPPTFNSDGSITVMIEALTIAE